MNYSKFISVRQALLLIFLQGFLAVGSAVHAAPLKVIFVDGLTLSAVYDTTNGPLTPEELYGAVVALISPGLPRGTDPKSNLYATLTAGDVAAADNPHNGLLERQLYASGADSNVTFELATIGAFSELPFDEKTPMLQLRSRIEELRISSPKHTTAPGIMLVGVVPLETDQANNWNRLTPIVWLPCGGGGSDPTQQPTLVSDTTQTPGLIALRDIAPTILQAENVPIPDSMSGHPAHLAQLGMGMSRDSMLQRMDQTVRTDQESLTPFGWVYGLGSGAVFFIAITMILRRKHTFDNYLRFLLRMSVAMPIALMIAPLGYVAEPVGYLIEIAIIDIVLASVPKVGALLTGGTVLIVADALTGSTMISRSLLSGYWLSGIRFYGIGNEYMGLLIGMALTSWFIAQKRHPENRLAPINRVLLATWFSAILFALAYPQFGAKAGGAVTAMAAFLPCWIAVALGKRESVWLFAASVVAGFAAVFGLSALATHFGVRETHIQAATTAVLHGKVGYIAHIVIRKAKMAVKVALMPGTLTAVIGTVPMVVIWNRSALRTRVAEFLRDRALYQHSLIAGFWGMIAAVLFNDSGVVAAFLLFGTLVLPLFHEMLCESSPSMLETSESELRSATSLSSAPIRSSP